MIMRKKIEPKPDKPGKKAAPEPNLVSPPSDEDTLYTPAMAARLLHVTPGTLMRWRALNKGPKVATLSPRVYRYRLADLRSYLAALVAE